MVHKGTNTLLKIKIKTSWRNFTLDENCTSLHAHSEYTSSWDGTVEALPLLGSDDCSRNVSSSLEFPPWAFQFNLKALIPYISKQKKQKKKEKEVTYNINLHPPFSGTTSQRPCLQLQEGKQNKPRNTKLWPFSTTILPTLINFKVITLYYTLYLPSPPTLCPLFFFLSICSLYILVGYSMFLIVTFLNLIFVNFLVFHSITINTKLV